MYNLMAEFALHILHIVLSSNSYHESVHFAHVLNELMHPQNLA